MAKIPRFIAMGSFRFWRQLPKSNNNKLTNTKIQPTTMSVWVGIRWYWPGGTVSPLGLPPAPHGLDAQHSLGARCTGCGHHRTWRWRSKVKSVLTWDATKLGKIWAGLLGVAGGVSHCWRWNVFPSEGRHSSAGQLRVTAPDHPWRAGRKVSRLRRDLLPPCEALTP